MRAYERERVGRRQRGRRRWIRREEGGKEGGREREKGEGARTMT